MRCGGIYRTVVTFEEVVKDFSCEPPEAVPPVTRPWKSVPPLSVQPVLMA